jgi:hypothetical protein
MTWKAWLVILAAAGVTAALGECQDKQLREYLGPNGEMYKWQEQVGKALCQLEEKSTVTLDDNKRICPDGEGGPNDKSSPPSYPPQ